METEKGKILIVEDDSFVSDIYQTKLKNAGFDVEYASNGKEALDKLSDGSKLPDLMLLDIIMPEMDGFDVLRSIQKEDKFKKMKVILLTNLGQTDDIKEGLKLGAMDYLIKSHFTPQEVLDKINVYLTS